MAAHVGKRAETEACAPHQCRADRPGIRTRHPVHRPRGDSDAAGKPVPGVDVFAYQTDQHGIYAAPGAADPWRLKGWAVTDAQGRFEFRTIRPAAYPSNTVPDTSTSRSRTRAADAR